MIMRGGDGTRKLQVCAGVCGVTLFSGSNIGMLSICARRDVKNGVVNIPKSYRDDAEMEKEQ